MKLYEYQAKKIFKENNIPVPHGIVCTDEKELQTAFIAVGKGNEAVLKAQALTGGRGKSGGIRIVNTPQQASETFREMMNMTIKGLPVSKVLVEEKLPINREYYSGITIDPTHCKPVALISSKGGIDIETIAKETPAALSSLIVDPCCGLSSYKIHETLQQLGIADSLTAQYISITKRLYKLFADYDATLIEINPLVETSDGKLWAADAFLNIDGNALFKHEELRELKEDLTDNPEVKLKDKGIYFVFLGGDVGLICAGAGMTMATMDLVNAAGGRPACFCDVSAAINPHGIECALRAVSGLRDVKSILVNMFGGLTRMDEVAKSLIKAMESIEIELQPIVIRLEGTNVQLGLKIMKESGFEVQTDLYIAVKSAVELAR